MAIVKVYSRENATRVLRYVFNGAQPGDPVDSELCSPTEQGSIDEFRMIREQYDFKQGNNQVFHVVQSWNEEESKKLSPKEFNSMGKELAGQYFKGHQFVVVTHTETGRIHNHIVVSALNMENGLSAKNKFKHWHALKPINDQICLAKGLSVPKPKDREKKTHLPQKVQDMVRAGRESWLMDIRSKADVARHLATGFDQYVDYMDAFGIKARVEEKKITYFYPGREKGKRGDKLGTHYDKAGLQEQFKLNDQRFRANPDILNQLSQLRSHFNGETSKSFHASSEFLAKSAGADFQTSKNYSSFTKNKRRTPNVIPLSERELKSAIISSDEIRKAKRSIPDYCKENNIPLMTNKFGQTVLKDRNHIVINGPEATNTKNSTRGSLIDFVAAHHRLTYLQAIAKINGTEAPALFENQFGAIQRSFTAFHIPKPEQMVFQNAVKHLGSFLKDHSVNHRVADELLKHQRAEVSNKGTIRLFAESDSSGTFEFTKEPNHTWKKTKHGDFIKPFFQRQPKRNKLFLYTEPFSYLGNKLDGHLSDRNHSDGILVLMEPNKGIVDHFLKLHPSINKINFVTPRHRSLTQSELDFFGVLKEKLNHQGIEVFTLSPEKSRSHEGLSF